MIELRAILTQYFGNISMIKAGLKPKEIIEKPDALILYEQIQAMGIPYSEGGIEDQPYIFLMEYRICDQEQKRFDALEAANDRQEHEDRLARLLAKK